MECKSGAATLVSALFSRSLPDVSKRRNAGSTVEAMEDVTTLCTAIWWHEREEKETAKVVSMVMSGCSPKTVTDDARLLGNEVDH